MQFYKVRSFFLRTFVSNGEFMITGVGRAYVQVTTPSNIRMSIAAFIKFTAAYEFIRGGIDAEICEGWFEIPDGFIYDDSLLTAAEVTQVMSNMIY